MKGECSIHISKIFKVTCKYSVINMLHSNRVYTEEFFRDNCFYFFPVAYNGKKLPVEKLPNFTY